MGRTGDIDIRPQAGKGSDSMLCTAAAVCRFLAL
jgi:hypothetical protein